MDNKSKILDIAMNLNRIGNWAADDFSSKKKRIKTFFDQTTRYVNSLPSSSFKSPFKKTFDQFLAAHKKLQAEIENPKDSLKWAEEMMTWGNILTHRSRLIK